MSLEINRKYFGVRHLYLVFYRKLGKSLPPFKNYRFAYNEDGRKFDYLIILCVNICLGIRYYIFVGFFSGLFMRDFHKFVEEMSSAQIDQEMRARTLRAFQIAEEIHQIIMPKAIKL